MCCLTTKIIDSQCVKYNNKKGCYRTYVSSRCDLICRCCCCFLRRTTDARSNIIFFQIDLTKKMIKKDHWLRDSGDSISNYSQIRLKMTKKMKKNRFRPFLLMPPPV